MASRQEEKRRRREERLAQERQADAASARTRRLQMVGGAVLVVAVVIVAVVLVASGGGGDHNGAQKAPAGATVAIPKPGPNANPSRLPAAAKAAGCTAKTVPSEGSSHVTTTVKYKSNPPTSGNHNPKPASDGIYDPGNSPPKEKYVHALEHGRVEIQYRPGTPKRTIDQLETLFGEKTNTKFGTPSQNGSFTLLFENNTGMPYAVAATAWTQLLACPRMNNKVFDAIRAFRARYTLQAPEKILQPE